MSSSSWNRTLNSNHSNQEIVLAIDFDITGLIQSNQIFFIRMKKISQPSLSSLQGRSRRDIKRPLHSLIHCLHSLLFLFIYFLYFFGCVRSQLEHAGSFIAPRRLLSSCALRVFSLQLWHVGSVVCGMRAPLLRHTGLVALRHVGCGILVPRPGIEPASPALEGGFFTTGPPGKSRLHSLLIQKSTKQGFYLQIGKVCRIICGSSHLGFSRIDAGLHNFSPKRFFQLRFNF